MSDELVDALARAAEPDPAVALPALRLLREWADQREGAVVSAAREAGWSWGAIASALGRSRQGLWERYRDA